MAPHSVGSPETQGQESGNRPRVPENFSVQGRGRNTAGRSTRLLEQRPAGAPAVGRQRPRRVILATPKAGGRAAARRICPRKEADLDRNLDGIRYALQDTGDGGGRAARELRCTSTFQSCETAPISPRRCRFVEKERGSRPILQNPMGEM